MPTWSSAAGTPAPCPPAQQPDWPPGLGADLYCEYPASAERRSALGSLLGTLTGAAVGGIYHFAAWRRPRSWVGEALLVSGAAMIAGNASMAAQGLTDPREWSLGEWLSDLVPHLAYGIATTDALGRRRETRPPRFNPAARCCDTGLFGRIGTRTRRTGGR